MAETLETTTCYRHPDRETGLQCSNCDRPICAECMRPTPVGQRCPECVGRQRTLRPRTMVDSTPVVTYALIAVNVAVFLLLNGGATGRGIAEGALYRGGEPWRVVTSMFLHASLLHLAFNMYALYAFGSILERRFGSVRYAVVYLVGGLFGAYGALLLSDPGTRTVGASGAIFGVLGAMFVVEQRNGARGLGGVGTLILLNLVITFAVPNISVGGHLGGLVGGVAAGIVMEHSNLGRRLPSGQAVAASAALVGVAVGLILTVL